MGFSFWSKNGQQGQQKKDKGSPSSSSKSAQSRKAHSSPMESIRSWISKIRGFFRTQEESASQVQRGNYGSLTGSNSLSSDSGTSSFTERRETEPTKEVKKSPIRIESVLEYWITLEFFKELDTSETNSCNFENLLKRIYKMPIGTKFRLFFGSIRKYNLLLPIYQENDSFLEETWIELLSFRSI